jgi:hypothetical protein
METHWLAAGFGQEPLAKRRLAEPLFLLRVRVSQSPHKTVDSFGDQVLPGKASPVLVLALHVATSSPRLVFLL